MRQIAALPKPVGNVRRVMVYDTGEEGVYLFLYDAPDDGPGFADLWFESVTDAVEAVEQEYGVRSADWRSVPDPLPGCQHDWVAPVRLRRGPGGEPLWGQFEPVPSDPQTGEVRP